MNLFGCIIEKWGKIETKTEKGTTASDGSLSAKFA